MPVHRNIGILIVTAIALVAMPAHASGTEAIEDVGTRLMDIQTHLDDRAPRANAWWYGWLAGFTALTVAQGTIAATTNDPGVRADQVVGAATSVLGIAGVVMSPVPTGRGARQLRHLRAEGTHRTEAQLLYAESLLREASEGETAQRNWVQHTLNAVVGLGSGAVLWAGWDRPVPGIIQAASSVAIGEVMILSTPRRGRRAWDAYQSRYGSGSYSPEKPEITWGLWMRPEGVVGLTARF